MSVVERVTFIATDNSTGMSDSSCRGKGHGDLDALAGDREGEGEGDTVGGWSPVGQVKQLSELAYILRRTIVCAIFLFEFSGY
jgi:hypothetical protein